ncbi:MAG: hypothetical protein E6K70_21435 [Planctomycetota bacterium]|nr:MAG: hypothetical protein E6K70_21435 [Planctomycetota bacterium]
MQQNWILHAVEHLEQAAGLMDGGQPACGKANVFLGQPGGVGRPALSDVPGQRIAATAQVHDRPNAVSGSEAQQLFAGKLGAAIHPSRKDLMNVAADEDAQDFRHHNHACCQRQAAQHSARPGSPGSLEPR